MIAPYTAPVLRAHGATWIFLPLFLRSGKASEPDGAKNRGQPLLAAHQNSCVIINLSTSESDASVKPWPIPNSTLFGSPL